MDTTETLAAYQNVGTGWNNDDPNSTEQQASIESLAGGGYVVAWVDGNTGDNNIRAQVFDVSGAPMGTAFIVNAPTQPGSYEVKFNVTIEALDNGGFAIAWDQTYAGTNGNGIVARVFDENGGPLGDSFVAGTYNFDYSGATSPELVAAPGGQFWVVSTSQLPYSTTGLFAQLVNSDGTVAAQREFVAFDTDLSVFGDSEVVRLADGNILAVWRDYGSQDTSVFTIHARLFDGAFNPLHPIIDVATIPATTGVLPLSAVALADGGFAIDWMQYDPAGSAFSANVKFFDASGVNTSNIMLATDAASSGGDLAVLADGNLLATWIDGVHVIGQLIDPLGSAIGLPFQVTDALYQRDPMVVALADGGFAATYLGTDPGIGWSVKSEVYAPTAQPGTTGDDVILAAPGNIDAIDGGDGNDYLGGTNGVDLLYGGTGDDTLAGGPGNDLLDGGGDADTAVYAGVLAGYQVVVNGGQALVTDINLSDGNDGADTLTNIESLRFADQTVQLGATNQPPTGTPTATLPDGWMNYAYQVLATDLLAGFSDPDGDTLSVANLSADHGTVTDNGSGAWTIAPSPGYVGPVNLSYDVLDGQGESLAAELAFSLTPITGTPNNDPNLQGTPHADIIIGLAGDDVLLGGDGNDVLNGGAGNDTLDGGAGDHDVADYSDTTTGVTVYLSSNSADGQESGHDTLVGIEDAVGGSGMDTFWWAPFAPSAVIDGGAGRDNAVLFTSAQSTVTAGIGAVEYAGNGKTVTAQNVESFIFYVSQSLTLSGDFSSSGLVGNPFALTFSGGGNADVLDATGLTSATAIAFYGSSGDDTVRSAISGANDQLSGESGFDTIDYGVATQAVTVNLAAGTAIGAQIGSDTLAEFEAVVGGSGDDYLTGNALANTLQGGDGNDVLNGGAGNDTLDGGAGDHDVADFSDATLGVTINLATRIAEGQQTGNDTLVGIEDAVGGSGNDTIWWATYAASALIDGGLGTDQGVVFTTPQSTVTAGVGTVEFAGNGKTLMARNIESFTFYLNQGLTLSGDFSSSGLVGNPFALTFSGSASADVLDATGLVSATAFRFFGGSGDDTVRSAISGANDQLSGESGFDTIDYGAATQAVTVDLAAGTAIGAQIGSDTLAEFERVVGGSAADQITGNALANTLEGGGGNDDLAGGAGNDILIGGQGIDTAEYTGHLADYGLVRNADGTVTITDQRSGSPDGTDTLDGIETLHFVGGWYDLKTLLNNAPVAQAASLSLTEDTVHNGSVAATDADNDALTYALVTGPSHGSLAFNADGSFVYTPTKDYAGADSFSFRANDGTANSNTATVSLSIAGVNDAPTITSNGGGTTGALTILENGTAVTTVLATDPDGPAAIAYSIVGGADAALFQIDAASGQLRFITAPDYEFPSDSGNDSTYNVVVRASDGSLFDDQALAVFVSDVTDTWYSGSDVRDVFTAPNSAPWVIYGNGGNDALTGAGGDDFIDGGSGDDKLVGGAGIDTVSYISATAGVSVSLDVTKAQATGGAGKDTISGFENLNGSEFNDILGGDAFANFIYGAPGNDKITGKGGADQLFGDLGADTFIYGALTDSTLAAMDTILDFDRAEGDKIDLHLIDAVLGNKNKLDHFQFDAGGQLTGKAGQLVATAQFDPVSGETHYIVTGDVNGDRIGDFYIDVHSALPLIQSDFILI